MVHSPFCARPLAVSHGYASAVYQLVHVPETPVRHIFGNASIGTDSRCIRIAHLFGADAFQTRFTHAIADVR
ncbi:hypothetical protein SMICM17S_02048 [Streptomyces microflavus]